MGKKVEDTKENDKTAKYPGVPLWKRFSKNSLRAWPSQTGDCLMSKEDISEKKHLSVKSILKQSSSESSEWCLRPHKAISDTVKCVKSVEPFLKNHFGPDSGAPEGRNGIREFAKFFESKAGVDFVKSCEALDEDSIKGDMSDKDVKKCLAKFIDFFSPGGNKTSAKENDLHKQLTRVAIVSSRLFVSSMTLLEANALINSRNSWSEKIDGMHGSWLGNPSDKKLLAEFLLRDINKNKSAARKKKTPTSAVFGDETEASATNRSSSDSSSSERKKKKKKDKKAEFLSPYAILPPNKHKSRGNLRRANPGGGRMGRKQARRRKQVFSLQSPNHHKKRKRRKTRKQRRKTERNIAVAAGRNQ